MSSSNLTLKIKPTENGLKKLKAVNQRSYKEKDLVRSDPIPHDVITYFLTLILAEAGEGIDTNCENLADEFINMVDRLWGSDGSDGSPIREPEEIPRCIATNYLYPVPNSVLNYKGPKKIRTDLSMWIVKSILPASTLYNGYTLLYVISSPKFRLALDSMGRNLGSHPVKILSPDEVDISKFNSNDLKGLNDSVQLIVFEFKRKIPQEAIDEWISENTDLGKKMKNKKNKAKYNKEKRKLMKEQKRKEKDLLN
jgi:hypothetical protein